MQFCLRNQTHFEFHPHLHHVSHSCNQIKSEAYDEPRLNRSKSSQFITNGAEVYLFDEAPSAARSICSIDPT